MCKALQLKVFWMCGKTVEPKKLVITDVRAAYQLVSEKLDKYFSLDPYVKLEMCDVLDCNPKQLQNFLEWLGVEGVYNFIFHREEQNES